MRGPRTPEQRARQSRAMKVWFADPANAALHAERQRKRFATPEGKAQQRRMAQAAARAKAATAIPKHLVRLNRKLREAGVPAARRIAELAREQQP